MKKRSLFAAVAMLVVSAIVLTSATYAWFAASSTASVGKIGATVTNADGTLQVAAAGTEAANTTFKGAISTADYDTSLLASTLSPVSFTKDTTRGTNTINTTPTKLKYDGDYFTAPDANAVENTDYLRYSFQVKYVNNDSTAKSVYMKPLTGTGADFALGDFCYMYVEVVTSGTSGTRTGYWYSSDGQNTYKPVIDQPTGTTQWQDVKTGNPAKGDGIVGDASATAYGTVDDNLGAHLGTAITADKGSSSEITLISGAANNGPDGTVVTVHVYIWAEGNDADCTGTVSAVTAGTTWSLEAR